MSSVNQLTPEMARKLMGLTAASLGPLADAKQKAFQAGQKAKREGMFRVSPYYGKKSSLDTYFFAGYDAQNG